MKTLLHETRLESLRLVRLSEAFIPTLTMPLLFYWLSFGLFDARGYQALTGLIIIAAMSPGAFSGAIYVAGERQSGWLSLRWQFSQWRWWLSKQISLALMALLSCFPVVLLAMLFGHVELSLIQACLLLVIAVFTSLLFSALGILCGLWLTESGAIAVSNMVFLPLILVSGLVIPLERLPLWLAHLSHWMPPYQLMSISTGQLPLGLLPLAIGLAVLTYWSTRRCTV